ncbi:hypothetical protein O2W15_05175 [Modestobacter sp. VKM Ac-2979]|uniref:hypothetical protein n=1 Tax=unclassified Modestobacter TaxID=2643866 RepID=UPI0022ABBA70|nr:MULTISPECIES: hypothetical protein [unclassified Modestobacter]MCZ2810821.1 hypothetical protein [Modestobacter sp. VKM Ac-2979]MCZ2840334.1 hypothetical protein [Modestobacter sp. VKM Ac-2980]
MELREPVAWAPGLSVLADTSPAAWIEAALTPTAGSATVAGLVPPVFESYARVLPPSYGDEHEDGEPRYRWPEIAAATGVQLTAEIRFDDLVAGSDRWGRPSDGGLDARETAILARVLGEFTGTPDEAYFCLWEGFGLPETEAWADRPMRVQVPHRAYHLLSGPVAVAPVLPTPVEWRCASLWWPADRAWLVATEIDGYLTYVGGSRAAIEAVLTAPDLDAVAVQPSTALDPSYG